VNHRLSIISAALLFFSGCGTLTRYYQVDAPPQQMQSVLDCLDMIAAQHNLKRTPCPPTMTLQGRKIACVRLYAGRDFISLAAAFDPATSSAIVFLHPVSGYRDDPKALQVISQELKQELQQRFGNTRVKLIEDWSQHWIWNIIPLET
jgi:hypothetical protein